MKKDFIKKKLSVLLLAIVVALGMLGNDGLTSKVYAASQTMVPIYRLYCHVNAEHLYTSDANEVSVLANDGGWVFEGVGWYAPENGIPVYRLYNSVLQNHLYTTDTNEISVLIGQHDGWEMDNNGDPLFYSGGSTNILRLYNRELRGLHLLTTDTNEYNVLPNDGCWQQEGTALNALAPSADVSLSDSTYYPNGGSDISNTSSKYSIEADVSLNGTGTGYHAKLVACTATSAVSFGIQYDRWGVAPYTNETTMMVENVGSNDAGGQTYHRTGYAKRGDSYHLMLTVDEDGTCGLYVNGVKVGSVKNSNLAGQMVYLRVEGSARLNGDTVDAEFHNIRLKGSGNYNTAKVWGTHNFDTNPGIHSNIDDYNSNKSVTILGTVTGLSGDQDWDNAYGIVSGITQFVE